jgi:hypothetical protein
MSLKELIKEREGLGYRIKVLSLKLAEIRETYFPARGENIGGGSSGNNSSPQEKLILRMDSVLEKIRNIQDQIDEIDKQIELKLLLVSDIKTRWIVLQRIRGIAWKDVDCYGLSLSRSKHIFREGCKELGLEWKE